MPVDGSDVASADVAMDKPALDVAVDVSRSGDDATDTASPVDAECYPGLAASCMNTLTYFSP